LKSPKISVCIPTYNYEKYISQAIDSVLSQTFTDFELLIADDCSSDSSDEVIKCYTKKDSRIKYIRHQKNLGMVENWNYCLRQARGKYIKFLFGDDFLVSAQALEKMYSVMEADASVSLVSSARMIVDDKSVKTDVWSYSNKDIVENGYCAIQRCLLRHINLIGEPTAVMFKTAQAIRGFNQQYRQIVDLEMWFHLLEQGRFAFLAEPLCAFRVHHQQQTAKTTKDIYLSEGVQIYKDYLHNESIEFKFIDRIFLSYNCIYKIWKQCYKMKELDREFARSYINEYGTLKFYMLFPIYKTYKPFRKLRQYMSRNKD